MGGVHEVEAMAEQCNHGEIGCRVEMADWRRGE